MNIQAQYDNAFSQCMYAKGEQVPGFSAVASAGYYGPGPVASAAPDPMVRSTQSELIRLGYYKGAADGFAGARTHAAISAFEQSNGLPVDGNPSSRLLARLQSTPTGSSMAASAPAPSAGWVSPSASSGATPVTASAPAASSWVAPTKTP
jgi:peptidoglycan hydrolase-like protein with peptidoglycan-binding domain